MYHPLFAWKPQEARRPGFSWADTFVPGGANGVEVKLKAPSNASKADNFGFNLQGLMMLRDQSPWGVSRSQKAMVTEEVRQPGFSWANTFVPGGEN